MPLRLITLHAFLANLPVLILIALVATVIHQADSEFFTQQYAHGAGTLTLLILLGTQANIIRDFQGKVTQPTLGRRLLSYVPSFAVSFFTLACMLYLHTLYGSEGIQITEQKAFLLNLLWLGFLLILTLKTQTLSKNTVLRLSKQA